MSLQAQLDEQALGQLAVVMSILKSVDSFSAEKIKCRALKEIADSHIPIDEMNAYQKHRLEESILSTARYFGWF